MFNYNNCRFIIGAQRYEDIPDTQYPEIAVIGRSNVGKSSIINTLVNSTKLARTSQNPGCTQQINMFVFNNTFILADLPGYGYSKSSNKNINRIQKLVWSYILNRRQLCKLFLLIDARREAENINSKGVDLCTESPDIATKSEDISTESNNINPDIDIKPNGINIKKEKKNIDYITMKAFSEHGVAFHIILTKCDKVSAKNLDIITKNLLNMSKYYPSMYNKIIQSSSKKNYGIDEIRKTILNTVTNT